MNNKDYWKQRAIDRDKLSRKDEDRLLKELYDLYEKSYKEVTNKLYAFYMEYGKDNNLTYQQAQKLLTPMELKECSRRIKRLSDLKESIDTSTPFGRTRASQIQREIQLLRSRGRVTREMLLADAINEEFINVAYKIDTKLGDLLKKTYENEYGDTLDELGITKTHIPIKQVESAILIPTYGNHFSDTVWKNKDKLVTFINTEIRKGLVQGTNVRKTSKKLQEQLNVTKYQADRLVRTENMTARIEGSLEGYKESGVVKEVIVMVTGDERTCKDCLTHDNDVVKLSEAVVGDNIPIFHPNCRCTIAPYIE